MDQPVIAAVAFEGFFVKVRPGVFQKIRLALGFKLAKVALEPGPAVDGFHVLDVAVSPARFEGARIQVALVNDVGGVDELMSPQVVFEARFVLATVDAAFERFLVEMRALMIEQIGFALRVEVAHVAFPRFPGIVAHGRAQTEIGDH